MSENTRVDQITKEPLQKIERVKDPKRVQAGRRLAEYHRKAKGALKQEEAREGTEAVLEDGPNSNWMPSMTVVLTMVGIGLTGLDLYLRWKKTDNSTIKTATQPSIEHHTVKETNTVRPSMIPVPRVGME